MKILAATVIGLAAMLAAACASPPEREPPMPCGCKPPPREPTQEQPVAFA